MVIVREFLVVFPGELSGLPSVRELEFGVGVVSGCRTISTLPYRMAPVLESCQNRGEAW